MGEARKHALRIRDVGCGAKRGRDRFAAGGVPATSTAAARGLKSIEDRLSRAAGSWPRGRGNECASARCGPGRELFAAVASHWQRCTGLAASESASRSSRLPVRRFPPARERTRARRCKVRPRRWRSSKRNSDRLAAASADRVPAGARGDHARRHGDGVAGRTMRAFAPMLDARRGRFAGGGGRRGGRRAGCALALDDRPAGAAAFFGDAARAIPVAGCRAGMRRRSMSRFGAVRVMRGDRAEGGRARVARGRTDERGGSGSRPAPLRRSDERRRAAPSAGRRGPPLSHG